MSEQRLRSTVEQFFTVLLSNEPCMTFQSGENLVGDDPIPSIEGRIALLGCGLDEYFNFQFSEEDGRAVFFVGDDGDTMPLEAANVWRYLFHVATSKLIVKTINNPA